MYVLLKVKQHLWNCDYGFVLVYLNEKLIINSSSISGDEYLVRDAETEENDTYVQLQNSAGKLSSKLPVKFKNSDIRKYCNHYYCNYYLHQYFYYDYYSWHSEPGFQMHKFQMHSNNISNV